MKKLILIITLLVAFSASSQESYRAGNNYKRYQTQHGVIAMVYESDISIDIVDKIFWHSYGMRKKYFIDYIEIYHMDNTRDIHCVIVFKEILPQDFLYSEYGEIIKIMY